MRLFFKILLFYKLKLKKYIFIALYLLASNNPKKEFIQNMKLIKQTFYFLILLILIPLAANSQNKYNLDFNDFKPEKEKMPAGWFKWGNFENLTGEIISEGNSVGKVVSDKDRTFGCITYRIPANYVGDTIVLSGKIKYENVKGYVGLLMRIDGNSKKRSLAFKSMQNQKIKGTSD